jgi:hypothetical protein
MDDGGFLLAPPRCRCPAVCPLLRPFCAPHGNHQVAPRPPPPHVRSSLLLRRSDTPHACHPPNAAIVFGLRCGAGGAGAPPPALVIPLMPRLRLVVAFEEE